MKILIAIMPFLLMVSCGQSTVRKQAQANAHAGVVAITDPGEEVIADGINGNIEAATGYEMPDLPRPTKTPKEIVNDPQGYKNESDQLKEKSFSGGFWATVGALGFTALGVLKFVPGAHQPIVSTIQMLLESKRDKASRQKQEGLALAAKKMMDCIEKYPQGAELKQKIAGKLPPEAVAAVQEYLKKFD